MKPILFDITATLFNNNGLGVLNDAARCIVTEERNGMFELEMDYPISGIHYEEIIPQRIILAKSTPTSTPQAFRIYRITKPLSGLITVYAQHISYDLTGAPVTPVTFGSLASAIYNLPTYSENWGNFTLWTNKSSSVGFKIPQPASARAIMGGTEGSLLDVYGGEWEWDNFSIKLWAARGQDRGVVLRYGKNITSLEQDTNIANVITGIYPFYVNEATLVTLPEKILYASGSFPRQNIVPLDLSSNFEQTPSVSALRSLAQSYINSSGVGVPEVSIEMSYTQLDDEEINLCDTVTVEFPQLGIDTKAKCVKTVYNALLDRYESVEIGDARSSIATTIANNTAQTNAFSNMLTYTDVYGGDTRSTQIKAGLIRLYNNNALTAGLSAVTGLQLYDPGNSVLAILNMPGGNYPNISAQIEENGENKTLFALSEGGLQCRTPMTGTGYTAYFSGDAVDGYNLIRSTSSEKYKREITPIKDVEKIIDAFEPMTYKNKGGDETVYYGLSAERVAKICPQLVLFDEGQPDGLQYDRIPVLLIKDAQKSHKKIAELEEKIAKLEALLNADNKPN